MIKFLHDDAEFNRLAGAVLVTEEGDRMFVADASRLAAQPLWVRDALGNRLAEVADGPSPITTPCPVIDLESRRRAV